MRGKQAKKDLELAYRCASFFGSALPESAFGCVARTAALEHGEVVSERLS